MAQVGAVEAGTAGLSEVERVVDTFVAPSKTFRDLRRSASWWLPFVLLCIVTAASAFVVDRQVGYDRVAENNMHQSPKQEEALQTLPADQRAARIHGAAVVTKYISYGSFVFILVFVAIAALLYWATLNFGLGATTTYKQNFALWMYASLPKLLTGLLAIVTLMFGGNAESYNVQNPVGTNPAYYMPDASPVIKAILSFFDVLGLWQLALLVLGVSIIAGISRGKAAAVAVGWWTVGLLVSVGIALASS